MRLLTNSQDYRQDFQYSSYALKAIMFFYSLGIGVEFFYLNSISSLIFIFTLAFSIVFFRAYQIALKNMHYTFWGLSLLFFVYLIYKFFYALTYDAFGLASYMYLLSIILLLIVGYLMSSPVYYPRVEWWEYDARFRSDIKGSLCYHDKCFPIRLIDLRRMAGGVVAFEEFPLGQELELNFKYNDKDFVLHGFLVSSGEYTPGRGITYGMKFISRGQKEEKEIQSLIKLWDTQSRKKFSKRLESQ